MLSILSHRKYGIPIRLFCFILITAALVFVPLAESFADVCESEHCENGCETCDDCLNCLPTIYMAPVDAADYDLPNAAILWSLTLPSVGSECTIPTTIDHPPQNS